MQMTGSCCVGQPIFDLPGACHHAPARPRTHPYYQVPKPKKKPIPMPTTINSLQNQRASVVRDGDRRRMRRRGWRFLEVCRPGLRGHVWSSGPCPLPLSCLVWLQCTRRRPDRPCLLPVAGLMFLGKFAIRGWVVRDLFAIKPKTYLILLIVD